MKPLILYHANCDDGFGAAFAAWLKFGDEAEYMPVAYGDKKFQYLEGPGLVTDVQLYDRDIYILDFSFSRPIMMRMMSEANLLVWLDHHKTAFEMWDAQAWMEQPQGLNQIFGPGPNGQHLVRLHNFKSGALLAWEYFHPDQPAPMLIQHIDDNDRWQFKLKTTKAFIAALRTWPHDFDVWLKIALNKDHFDYHQMCDAGEAILRSQRSTLDMTLAATKRRVSIKQPPRLYDRNMSPKPDELKFGEAPFTRIVKIEDRDSTCFADGLSANLSAKILTSDAGHDLATESGTFGLLWYLGDKGDTAHCSLRSNGDYDVSAIAKVFGGGGHRNAAGFQVPIATLLSWLE